MQRTASILGKRMTQEVSADDLLTYNSTKKKVFAVIPFDKISSSSTYGFTSNNASEAVWQH